jgi:hypothetical protein
MALDRDTSRYYTKVNRIKTKAELVDKTQKTKQGQNSTTMDPKGGAGSSESLL